MADVKLVVFRIAGQDYAADIRDVQEVIRPPAVTPLPHPAPPVLGVFNLRGHIVTAVDGAAALGLPASGTPSQRTVIVHANGRTAGLVVDTAHHVLTVDDARVRPAPESQRSRPVKGILIHDGRPIVLLDVPHLLGQRPSPEARPNP